MKSKNRKQFCKFISLLLVIALLCPIFTNIMPISAYADETNEQNEYVAKVDLPSADLAPLVPLSEVPNFISQEQVEERGHISRLTDEENLNSVVYLNRDGTKTKYITDYPVKYVDSDGNTKFVDLSLVESNNKFQTAANDILLSISKDYTDGIALSYKEHSVSLVALPDVNFANSGTIITAPITIATKNNNAVTYNDVFGVGVDIKYSPLHNGVKEDIILHSYNGVNAFDFLLNTGGLGVYSEDNGYYLAETANADMRMDLGKVIIYDANHKISEGSLTVTTLKENQLYQATVSVDEAFLADPNTVYPVQIDPSITVSDTTHGANAVTDCPVYSGKPTVNMGTALYNPIGYLDSAYQIGRTAVKLVGLANDPVYQGLSAAQIQSAYFYIKDSSGTAAKSINLYALTSNSTWTESSLTWNTLGTISTTLQASANVGGGAWSSFNITNLVKGWKSSSYNINCGFILQSSNESVAGNFFSSEAAESNWPYVVITYLDGGSGGGNSFATAKTIYLADVETVDTVIANEIRYFKFVPTETAKYVILSNNYTGDPKVWLYNSAGSTITSQDDVSYPSNKNFWLKYTLQAGSTYYIGAGHATSNVGGYHLMILKSADFENGLYHVRNQYSGKRLDICGPTEQIYVHQWTAHTEEQEKWLVQGHVENGTIAYYTIRSQYGDNKYIGISGTNTGENNIQLFDSIGDNTKWNIYSTPAGPYYLEPITAKGRSVYAADTGTGTKMQLSWIMPVSMKTKWYLDAYTYSDVSFTFSAFDIGDSNQDEAGLVKQKLAGYGYTSIGTYNNKDKYIPLETPIDLGQYSDIVYINSHGGRGAYMWHQSYEGDTAQVDGYIGADASYNNGSGLPFAEVGAQFKSGSTTITDSKWNQRTKWAIFGGCHQLSYQSNSYDDSYYGSIYNADWWARTMLGDGTRMHGILGYYKGAPPADISYDRLNKFLTFINTKTILNAWKDAHSQLLDESTNWAMIYHSANAEDTIYNYTASTASGSAYTINIVMRETPQQVTYSTNPPVEMYSNGLTLNEAHITGPEEIPVFIDSVDQSVMNNIYSNLETVLCVNEYDNLEIDQSKKITYTNSASRMGEADLNMSITEDEAIGVALEMLDELGLYPTGDYRARVSTIKRYSMDLTGQKVSAPETIEYTVSIYRTVNGLDFVSDQDDGIVISFDKYGLTTLHYKWRDIATVSTKQTAAIKNTVTEQQARDIYKQQMAQSGMDLRDDEVIVRKAYAQDGQTVRVVWVCSYDNGYGNHIFVDCNTGEIITI